jgi:hypothetical protein
LNFAIHFQIFALLICSRPPVPSGRFPGHLSDAEAQQTKEPGITEKEVEAHMWFSLGAAAGDADARLRLSDLEKRMAPAQIVEGKRRADAWLAQHQRR